MAGRPVRTDNSVQGSTSGVLLCLPPAAAEVQKCSDPVFNFFKYFLLFLFHTVYYNIETLNLPPAKERSPSYKHRILLFSFFHL